MTRTFGGVAEVVVEAFDGAATSSAVLDRILDSAGGRRVVLPVPGGASTTSGPRSGMRGRSSAAGKPAPMVARSNWWEGIGMIVGHSMKPPISEELTATRSPGGSGCSGN